MKLFFKKNVCAKLLYLFWIQCDHKVEFLPQTPVEAVVEGEVVLPGGGQGVLAVQAPEGGRTPGGKLRK